MSDDSSEIRKPVECQCRDCVVEQIQQVPTTRFYTCVDGKQDVEVLWEDFFFAAQEKDIAVDGDFVQAIVAGKKPRAKKVKEFLADWSIKSVEEPGKVFVAKPFEGTSEEALAAGWTAVEHGGFLCPDCTKLRTTEDPGDIEHGATLEPEWAYEAAVAIFGKEIVAALKVLAEAVRTSNDPDKSFGILVRGLTVMAYPREKKQEKESTDVHQG